MKKDASKVSLAVLFLITLELFILNPAFAVSDCNLVCDDSYVIETASDLEALSGCSSVTGNIDIRYSPLTNLEGLKCLTHIGGDLWIRYNTILTSLEALNNLTSIGGSLWISNNNSVTSLEGLKNLTSIGGFLKIRSNNSLTSLQGLDNLKSINEDLIIRTNQSLTSLEGLDKLESIGKSLTIIENPELCTNLAEALRDQVLRIGGDIYILDNKDC